MRDRGGYETTALLHTHGRGGKGQPRVLYYFRTPPNVRVGRSPIDEDAIRLLEEHNPDVEFDWTRILKATPAPAADEKRERRKERGRDKDRRGRDERPPAQPRPPQRPAEATESRQATDLTDQGRATDLADHTQAEDLTDQTQATDLTDQTDQAVAEMAAGENGAPWELGVGSWELASELPPESAPESPSSAPEPHDHATPVLERLGAEGLARLRARYAEVLARIAERPLEEAQREQLKLQAERLNPDTWVTPAEVAEALEQYEAVFESLRAVVGSGHRRRRRRRQG